MGVLIDGAWHDQWYDTKSTGGHFVRKDTQFRSWVTPDGSAGPRGEGGHPAEKGRYVLYVSRACPWAHRTLVFRELKGLHDIIDVAVVHWRMRENGWTFDPGPGVVPDPVHGARFLHQVYTANDPRYSGHVTVPVLWDKKTGTIVNNESADILRMMNSAWDGQGARAGDYYPAELREEIDAINTRVYGTVNNGVYRAGFATTQQAYEEGVRPLFESLDWLEGILAKQRYLCGARLTEADIRLFTTLLRFDAVYHGHFKCNLRRVADYPNLTGFVRELYQLPGVAETVSFDHIKRHYYESHVTINPTGIVPVGPILDFTLPHGRG
jgi:glutathionyl-hydroquinone reductase